MAQMRILKKTTIMKKPRTIYEKLKINGNKRTRKVRVELTHETHRENPLLQAVQLYTNLPSGLQQEKNMLRFKRSIREWIKSNIKSRP